MDMIEYSFVVPRRHRLVMDGQEVVVSPLRVDQLEVAAGALVPLVAVLQEQPEDVQVALHCALEGLELNPTVKGVLARWALELISRHTAHVVQLVAACTEQSPKWVASLLPDRLLVLLLLSVEVNADFFARMLPSLAGLVKGLHMPGAASSSAGPTPSNSLSPTGTGTTTSAATPSPSFAPTSNAASSAIAASAAN